ncbi:hypothetical protein HRI_003244400 [Hibiscus trionum]|uniref:GAG-pre-integrase domain-containing protein n=1 Tax=Hibiscus trionum TaxID=183268 RepID=A0A9W7MCM8_HIBTR|nr:hypothetical protein HRI_003244400 [Hibiscus trionum]
MGNGCEVQITHVGLGNLLTANRSLCLRNFLCVPDIKRNLLTVSQFARDNGVFFEFHSHNCFFKDARTKAILLEGRLTPEGLYELHSFDVLRSRGCDRDCSTIANNVASEACLVSKDCVSLEVWHKCLGHPSLNVLKNALSSCNIVVSNKKLSVVCLPSLQGKAHKLPFHLSTTEYDAPFQLIVLDVWGPAHTVSDGFYYYISFIDVYSKFT